MAVKACSLIPRPMSELFFLMMLVGRILGPTPGKKSSLIGRGFSEQALTAIVGEMGAGYRVPDLVAVFS